MARNDILSPYATTISHDYVTGETIVTYHKTQICRINKGERVCHITLGSRDTVTTRRKLNQCSLMWSLGFSVCRKKGITYLETPWNHPIEMEQNMLYSIRY